MTIITYKNDLPDEFNLPGDLAIDTETMGLNVNRDRLCVLQMSFGDNNAHLIHFSGEDYSAPNLKKLLLDNRRVKIFHFARFDIAIIKKYLEIDIDNIFCTKIASRLTRTYTDFHGLKELCRELLNVNLSKQQQTSDWGAKELSEEQKDYAAKDVLYLHALREILHSRLIDLKRDNIAQKAFAFLPTRAELDIIGWKDEDIFAHS